MTNDVTSEKRIAWTTRTVALVPPGGIRVKTPGTNATKSTAAIILLTISIYSFRSEDFFEHEEHPGFATRIFEYVTATNATTAISVRSIHVQFIYLNMSFHSGRKEHTDGHPFLLCEFNQDPPEHYKNRKAKTGCGCSGRRL